MVVSNAETYSIVVDYVDKEDKQRYHVFEHRLSRKDTIEISQRFQEGKTFMVRGRLIDPFEVEIKEYHVYDKNRNDLTRIFAKSPPPSKTLMKPTKVKETSKSLTTLTRNVFIVHGRDHKPMNELKTMLYDFGLIPIVLHEKASGGLTLAEKLEKYSEDVGYAFVILTPDDMGCQETEVQKSKSRLKAPILRRPKLVTPDEVEQLFERFKRRARQNVIFEMGYFWGLLERKKVCCLLKGDVEKPSNIEGIVYIHFKDSINEVQVEIIKELTEAGYEIKM